MVVTLTAYAKTGRPIVAMQSLQPFRSLISCDFHLLLCFSLILWPTEETPYDASHHLAAGGTPYVKNLPALPMVGPIELTVGNFLWSHIKTTSS
jgi:hypothetical protein